jgi:prepilin peptidase CpaA
MTFPWMVATTATIVALFTDVRHFRIPNLLTGPLLLSGLVYAWGLHGLPGLFSSGAGVVAGFIFLLPLYLIGGMGAGDVKLMGALGAWLKVARILDVLVVSCLLTAAVSFLMLWRRRRREESSGKEQDPESAEPSPVRERVEHVVRQEDRRERLIPFTIMILAGLVVAWFRA